MFPNPPKISIIINKIKWAWHLAITQVAWNKGHQDPPLAKRNIYANVVCGWHSGFRPCCILFYLFWIKLPTKVHYFISNLHLLENFHYTPCPLCYCLNRKHLRPIPCSCCPCIGNNHMHWCKNNGAGSSTITR